MFILNFYIFSIMDYSQYYFIFVSGLHHSVLIIEVDRQTVPGVIHILLDSNA